jgi:hypothetical protein
MGSLTMTQHKCPRHPNSNLDVVCLHPRCIEPLCRDCLPYHHEQHNTIGTQPNPKPLYDLYKAFNESARQEAKIYGKMTDFSEEVRELSTPETIKEYAREYFLRKRPGMVHDNKEIPLNDLLLNIEMAEKLKEPTVREAVRSFLKVHLKVNDEVVDEEFRPLY